MKRGPYTRKGSCGGDNYQPPTRTTFRRHYSSFHKSPSQISGGYGGRSSFLGNDQNDDSSWDSSPFSDYETQFSRYEQTPRGGYRPLTPDLDDFL